MKNMIEEEIAEEQADYADVPYGEGHIEIINGEEVWIQD